MRRYLLWLLASLNQTPRLRSPPCFPLITVMRLSAPRGTRSRFMRLDVMRGRTPIEAFQPFLPDAASRLAVSPAEKRSLPDLLSIIAPLRCAIGSSLATLERQYMNEVRLSDGSRAKARFARLGSVVDYEELPARRRRTIVLVAPVQADEREDRISTLAPMGRALLGLCAGSVAVIVLPDGQSAQVKITAIHAGGFHE